MRVKIVKIWPRSPTMLATIAQARQAASHKLADTARRGGSDDRILPLINVVFLLLIFFMLAGRLSVTGPFPVEPPESASQGLLQDAPLVVYVAADGRTALGERIVSREQLAAGVRKRLDGVSDVSVQLKADARSEALDVVELMGLLREAGVDKLTLLTVLNAP